MSSLSGSEEEAPGPEGTEFSAVQDAFASLCALFEKSVSAIPLDADERDQLARRLDERLAAMKDSLDPESIGSFPFLAKQPSFIHS